MSTYMGVTNFQNTVRFFGPPCIDKHMRIVYMHFTTLYAIEAYLVIYVSGAVPLRSSYVTAA